MQGDVYMQEVVSCVNVVDYSSVTTGDKILPFEFVLNLEDSILYPEEGELQKFCYDVTAKGQDTSDYADLSHFLLGICDEITREDIESVTVVVDGVSQPVIWDENVEIKTVDHPDNPTGCIGLKFDFGLDKVDGTMQVCFELKQIYPIGPINICLFGGNTTATGLSICGPVCSGSTPCNDVFYQKETVCVSVTVTPYATPGEIKTTCCGAPIVTPGGSCEGSSGSCVFTVRQSLCVEIPITFEADVETSDAVIQCGEVSEEGCDCNNDTIAVIGEVVESRERGIFGRR